MMLPFTMAGNIRTDYTLMPALTELCNIGNVRQLNSSLWNLWTGLWSSGELGRGKSVKALSPTPPPPHPPPFPFPFLVIFSPKQRACSQATRIEAYRFLELLIRTPLFNCLFNCRQLRRKSVKKSTRLKKKIPPKVAIVSVTVLKPAVK